MPFLLVVRGIGRLRVWRIGLRLWDWLVVCGGIGFENGSGSRGMILFVSRSGNSRFPGETRWMSLSRGSRGRNSPPKM